MEATDEKIREAASIMGKKGGATTLARHGREHYRKIRGLPRKGNNNAKKEGNPPSHRKPGGLQEVGHATVPGES